jgi:proteasome activator subunit 4
MLFRIWDSINSYMFDERNLEFLASLAEMHVASDVSDPRKAAELPDDAKSEGEGRPQWSEEDLHSTSAWPGIYKDVGIFTEVEWSVLMCKCINSMEIPLADGGSLTTGPSADRWVAAEIGRLPKPQWRIRWSSPTLGYSVTSDMLRNRIFSSHYSVFHGPGWKPIARLRRAHSHVHSRPFRGADTADSYP